MKALSLSREKQLEIIETEKPRPQAGEVLVAIKSAALNHREIWISKGMYPGMTLPSTLGADGAGVVVEVGAGVDAGWLDKEVMCYPAIGWGDNEEAPTRQYRLYGMPLPGFIAEYIVLPEENLVEKPAYLSWDEAAAVPVASLTAWRGLVKHGRIQPNDNVLITGIGGGVAQAGLSFATAYGANVYVTSSHPDKMAYAQSQGAVSGFNYREADWEKALAQQSGGIDIVLDGAPPQSLDTYMPFLKVGSKVIVYGSTAGQQVGMNIARFFLRHVSLIGTAMGSPKEFKEMIAFMEQHQIKPLIYKSFSFADAIEAFETLATGKQVGKITIQI
ncbi:MAG: zinc-binding dehydrogenase [Chloroflexota bacterium]